LPERTTRIPDRAKLRALCCVRRGLVCSRALFAAYPPRYIGRPSAAYSHFSCRAASAQDGLSSEPL
jgi:hypothetical protein